MVNQVLSIQETVYVVQECPKEHVYVLPLENDRLKNATDNQMDRQIRDMIPMCEPVYAVM